MEQVQTIKCGCGQTTRLEWDGTTWCYARNPHGSTAPQSGCFNCHRPLDLTAPAAAPIKPAETATAAPSQPEPVTEATLAALKTKADIEAFAAARGVDLSGAKTNEQRKAALIEALLAPPEAAESDVDDAVDDAGDSDEA
jgi:hypothetical protein